MDFFDLLHKRRACHTFIPGKTIPDEDFTKMIEHTALTPSGYNAQPWEFIVIREPENIQKIADIAFDQEHIRNASAIVVVLGDMEIGRHVDELLADWLKFGYCTKEELPAYRNSIAKVRSPEKRKDMALRNSMLAAMTLLFVAENMGYATCPLMGFSQWKLQEFLEIPEDRIISLVVAVGYGDPQHEKPRLPRKSADQVMHWEKFKNS